jgi:anti-sigma B factor antagonist
MSEPQHLNSRIDQGVLVLSFTEPELRGDPLAEAIRQEMLDAVTQAGAQKVVIDFQGVRFLSSAAFRPLLSLRRKLHETRGQLVLCGLAPPVADVFRLTRLISTSRSSAAPFEAEPDVAAAIARLNA